MPNSIVADSIRPFWVQGLNSVTGSQLLGIRHWLLSGNYTIDHAVGSDNFALYVVDEAELLRAFAADLNRFSVASVESSVVPARHKLFPKSSAWMLIGSYYAAFFAAHALLRSLGISCTRIVGNRIKRINDLADLSGMLNEPLQGGLFLMRYDRKKQVLEASKLSGGNRGVHELFWEMFAGEIDDLSNLILSSNTQSSQTRTLVYGLFVKLLLILQTHKNGSWLSNIRNEINYSHEFDAWYPHRKNKAYYDGLFTTQAVWRQNPETIPLDAAEDLKKFLQACAFIVSLSRTVVEDLGMRCPSGKSFLDAGAMRMLNLERA